MAEVKPGQIYTADEVADFLKCSLRQVYRLLAAGEIQGFKVGRLRRFRGEEILRYIAHQAGQPATENGEVQRDKLYTLQEVAKLLQLPPNEVLSLARQGQLPGFRVGMAWRFWGRDLLKMERTEGDFPAPTIENDQGGDEHEDY
ncbi:MAG: helix-turn-helix domain-containing protein [Anaerolineae bacterium]